jgi:hypothetical protein
MIPTGPLFHKPKSIIAARNILYSSLFLAILGILLLQFVLNVAGYPNMKTLIVNGALLILFYLAITYIGFGKKWARTFLLVLFILNVAAIFRYVSLIFNANLVLGFLLMLQILLQIVALIYLYSKSSNEWFNRFESIDKNDK